MLPHIVFVLLSFPLLSLPPSPLSLSLPSSQVHETEKMLTNWMQRVAELRSQYDWLLFFSVPKLLLVYHLLQEGNVEGIVHEISFLCSNEQDAWKSAQVEVKVRAEREGNDNDTSNYIVPRQCWY